VWQDVWLDELQLVTPVPEDDWRHHVVSRTEPALFMAWEYRPTEFSAREGLDILCPMWMELVMGDDGPELVDLSDMGYTAFDPLSFVEDAHEAGTQIWATVVGFVPTATAELVRNEEAVQETAQAIAQKAEAWNLDGIDLDFESMDPDDTERFTAFAAAVKKAIGDKKLSVCVTVPMAVPSRSPYQAYDRRELAKVCDYINVMTYDGHKEGIIAPVAGEDWVRYRIELLLREVPSNQILLGIPMHGVDFYRAEGSEEAYTGRMTITQEHLASLRQTGTMTVGKRTFDVKQWLEVGKRQEGSNILLYSFLDTEDQTHWIYLEDEQSLRSKIGLVEEYSLGGAAVWQKRAGDERWWSAMDEAMEIIQEKDSEN